MEGLVLRQQLKERFRSVHINKNNNDNHVNFFGTSKTVLSSRVTQEINSLVEKPKSAVEQLGRIRARSSGTKAILDAMEKREKVQKIRDSRDYSFLFSDDCDKSVPGKKDVPDQEISVSGMKNLPGRVTGYGSSKILKKQCSRAEDMKENASRISKGKLVKERSLSKGMVKNVPSRTEGSKKNCDLEKLQKRKFQESMKGNQQSKILAQAEARRRKDEAEEAIGIIRRMFRYDPKKYRDDRDDIMEASFADIEKEERRSAKLAKKEDDEELQKLVKTKRSKSSLLSI